MINRYVCKFEEPFLFAYTFKRFPRSSLFSFTKEVCYMDRFCFMDRKLKEVYVLLECCCINLSGLIFSFTIFSENKGHES